MILDTEFLIALKTDDPDAVAFAGELESAGVPTRIPSVVVEELYVGVGAGESAHHDSREFERLVGNKPIVELDENIARRAGVLEGEHLSSDSKPTLGSSDAVVAATALTFGEPVVTRDDDFESVDGLRVESY
jgi:tRNA(fMet)-specific endonuclease VapC